MGLVIVIAGKGGTGKTTLASLLVRIFKENKRGSILAVDADPNSNLAEALGLKVSETIADIIDDVKDKPQEIPQGISKDRFIEYRIQTSIAEGEGFDLLTLGRPEGPGCYCYVNNVLRDNLGRLIKEYDLIVIDNAAGLEHLSRRLSSSADFFIIVSDATPAGLCAAARIHQLRQEMKIKIKKEFLILNRTKNKNINLKKIEDLGLDYLGSIPEDDRLTVLSLDGGSLLDLEVDSLAFKSIVELERRLWQRN